MDNVNPEFALSCRKTVCARTYNLCSSLPNKNFIFLLHTIVAGFLCVSSPAVAPHLPSWRSCYLLPRDKIKLFPSSLSALIASFLIDNIYQLVFMALFQEAPNNIHF